jgi:hypothetical protein
MLAAIDWYSFAWGAAAMIAFKLLADIMSNRNY